MTTHLTKPSAEIRQAKIRQLLQGEQQVSIRQLAKMFGVSEMTARRDLEKLESECQVRRTRGGATMAERMEFEFDFARRRQANLKAKQAIAAEALKLVQPSQNIILDTGTTTLELAYLLRGCQDITIITPSLAVASVLHFARGVHTVLLGGVLRRGSPDLTGVVTEANLDRFAVDTAFQGADGIGLDGTLYNSDLRIAKVDQKIRQRAERTYILADSSKIGRTALATNGYVNEVDALITDSRIDVLQREALEKLGARVLVASL